MALAEGGRALAPAAVGAVWARRTRLPLFAKAWLAAALATRDPADARAAQLAREIENAAVETAGAVSFGEERVESARMLWHSERRTDAIVLGMLLRRDASNPLVEKVARGLLAGRSDGRWATTQENAWALDALVRYWRERESATPDLAARAWLGADFLGETRFEGRTARVVDGFVPMAELRRSADSMLTLAHAGQGRLYYRAGLRYAPSDLVLGPEEQGFSVTRRYEPIGDPSSVRLGEDGTWHIKAESVVRVRLTVVVPSDRYDVALDDPLPAGLEAVDTRFRTAASQGLSGQGGEQVRDTADFWSIFAFDHRELRDDRMVAFASQVSSGVYELTYFARATTPGRFLAQPTRAEEMYAPETFGRASTAIVVVEP